LSICRGILEAAKAKGGKLPPVLFLQLDNCWRENKNTTMFGYLSWLVEMGFFQKICLGFFPVGYVNIMNTIGVRHVKRPFLTSSPPSSALNVFTACRSRSECVFNNYFN